MNTQQQQPIVPNPTRLDSNVVVPDSEEWAKSTQTALVSDPALHTAPGSAPPTSTIQSSTIPSSTVHTSTIPSSTFQSSTIPSSTIQSSTMPSSTVPNASAHVISPQDHTALDTLPKSQAQVDSNLNNGGTSTVSTPGVHVPGAWTDKPSTAEQIYTDVSNTLASVGETAYNILPEGIKNAVSSSPTKTTSPVQTTTNNNEPKKTLGDHANDAMSAAAISAGYAGEAIYSKASDLSQSASNTYNQYTTDSVDKTKMAQPVHNTATLPSQDVEGQLPYTHTDGVGALPGTVNEQSVAVPPEARDSSTEFAQHPTQSTTSPSTTAGYTATLASAATAAAAALQSGANTAYNKASEVYNNPSAYVPGRASTTTDAADTSVVPHPTQTLPSQELEGQRPYEHTDGAGALPGTFEESKVALLPEEKANPNPLATATSEYRAAKVNTTLASPYNTDSPYSDAKANEVSQPHGANTAGAPTTKSNIESKAKDVKESVMPSSSEKQQQPQQTQQPTQSSKISTAGKSSSSADAADSGSPTSPSNDGSLGKKPSLMSRIKGEAKILTGKMSNNDDKVEAGRALKTGGQP